MADPNQTTGRIKIVRTIIVGPEASARIIKDFGDALISPIRDDGSSKEDFRRG